MSEGSSQVSGQILVVDDDQQSLISTSKILRLSQYSVLTAANGEEALELLRQPGQDIALVVTDVRMPRMGGIELLKTLNALGAGTPVILMTAYGQIKEAVWAMKFGAVDFLTKPFNRQTLLQAVSHAFKRLGAKQRGQTQLVADSLLMQELVKKINKVGATQATVLINGESGTGKEVVAREIHRLSSRDSDSAPFIAINCAAIPENLLESELFGYEKGAFSGAQQSKKGLFESAQGGTLFLDEVGDMPLSLQSKLLRVLQSGEVRRLGSSQSQIVKVRIISATHKDLRRMVSEKQFREDLLFRLDVVNFNVPPLRSRPEDLETLVQQLIAQFAHYHRKDARLQLSSEVWRCFRTYPWPGNVRELMNVLERAVVFCDNGQIELSDLPPHLLSAIGGEDASGLHGILQVPLGTSLKDVEDLVIQKTLQATEGDKNIAAKILGINSRTIQRRTKG